MNRFKGCLAVQSKMLNAFDRFDVCTVKKNDIKLVHTGQRQPLFGKLHQMLMLNQVDGGC